ncbi:MAG: hypothetical protein LC754_09340 [Acidobacteria bacterium]|nr:hypothetical protein [Acidobacteriota bacterium]
MFKRIVEALRGLDALTRASRGSDRQAFADLFARSSIVFLQLPPGLEGGLDPDVTQDELLAMIRECAQDLAGQEQFVPLCDTREGRTRLVVFTRWSFAQEYAHACVRENQRIMPFQLLTIEGRLLVRSFKIADCVVLNAGSKSEYELSTEDIALLSVVCGG